MAATDIVLRPAWRNYWALLLLVAALFGASVATLFAVETADGDPYLVFSGILAVAAVFVFVVVLLKRLSWKYVVDDQRVTRHYGLISRNQQSVRIQDLRSVELNQSVPQRIFGVGDLSFYSAGSAEAEVGFHGVKGPEAIRDRIDELADRAKTRPD